VKRTSKPFKTMGRKPPSGLRARVIRDAEFSRRLRQACDAASQAPAGHGRLTWIQRVLQKKFDESVSLETVRKWFAGEVKPRPEKLKKLAQLLEVDHAWLSLGVDPDLQPRDHQARNARVDGSINLVAGLIQMDGGSIAFPDEADKEALKNHIDLHAIIKGAKYDFHISPGEVDGRKVKFAVPANCGAAIVLGLIKRAFIVEIVEITPELISTGARRGGSFEVLIELGKSNPRKIESFKSRL
jgi:hypothetical protein